MTTKIKVSILILNWNGKEFLKHVLPSVKKLKSKHTYEMIVVDNASKEDDVKFIKKKFPGVRIIQNDKNYGMAGLNYAIPKCNGEYILFMGNDMELEPGSMDRLVEVLDKDKTVAFALPRLMNFYRKNILDTGADWMSHSFYTGKLENTDNKTIIESNGGGTGLLRKSVIPKIGYFYDKDFFAGCEDVDLGMRIRLAGFRTVYVPTSVMYHMDAATLKKIHSKPKATYLAERNYLIIFFKICSLQNLILLFPYVFLMRFFVILRDIIFHFDFRTAFARIRAIFWVLLRPWFLARKRKEIQKLRKAPDKYIFKNFTEKYLIGQIF